MRLGGRLLAWCGVCRSARFISYCLGTIIV
nr:MAG TPA: hypothetical protein [Caudoviricetes sp.]